MVAAIELNCHGSSANPAVTISAPLKNWLGLLPSQLIDPYITISG
jgi:hypothetical protein